jgi:two-component system response regulator RstA
MGRTVVDSVDPMTSSTAPRLMIVEDDEKLSTLLADYFTENGFTTEVISRGDVAAERILATPPHLVILDGMLPGLDGNEVCRRVRDKFKGGILMLTARKGEVDEVLGLELGADDFVTKPAYPRILLARVKSLMRRLEGRLEPDDGSVRAVGRLRLDRKRREVSVDGKAVKATSIEFDILWVLSSSPGDVVSRDVLYREVHQAEYDGMDRGMDIHLSRLRQKLVASGLDGTVIKSVRATGYLLAVGG